MSLSEHEEWRLIGEARTGGGGEHSREATAALVDAYMPLLKKLATRFWSQHPWIAPREDLIQQAVLGFLDALERFDPNKGARLGTLAMQTVMASLRQARTEYLGLSEAARQVYGRVWQAYVACASETGRPPTTAETAAASGVKPFLVDEVLQSHRLERLPAGQVPAPAQEAGPERAVVGQSIWWIILEQLAQPDGAKWIGLLLLHETEFDLDHDWVAIARELGCPEAAVAGIWPDLCDRHQVPPTEVPDRWPPFCALFPPPGLTEEAVRQWYCRKKRVLVPYLKSHSRGFLHI